VDTPPPEPSEPSRLERDYRRVLRLLPAGYRQRWADDMVGALLDAEQSAAAASAAGEGPERQAEERAIALLQRPPLREVAGVAALAVRLHLASPQTPGASTAARLRGDAVRRVALVGLLAAAGPALLSAVTSLYTPVAPELGAAGHTRGDAVTSAVWALAWVAAYALLVTGRYRTASVLAALVVVPDLRHPVETLVNAREVSPGTLLGSLCWLLVVLVPLAALLAWRSDAPRPGRWWLLALPVVAALGLAPWLLWRATGVMAAPDAAGSLCLGAAACAVVALRRRDASWMGSAALLAAVGGAGSLGQLALLAYPPGLERDLGWTALVLLGLAVAVGVIAVLTRGRLSAHAAARAATAPDRSARDASA